MSIGQVGAMAHEFDSEVLEGVAAMAIAATEFHQSAYYLPLAVRLSESLAPELVCVVAPSLVGYPVLSDEGEWRPTYMPMALRCLPLGLAAGTADVPGDAGGLVRIGAAGAATPYAPEPGDAAWRLPTAARVKLLAQVAASLKALAPALDQLCLAGLLVPLVPAPDKHGAAGLLTVDGERYASLARAQLGALARESFVALDIAGALLLSRRRLPARLRRAGDDGLNPIVQTASLMTTELPDMTSPMLELSGVCVDDSETFGWSMP